jgi:hypothetical protein
LERHRTSEEYRAHRPAALKSEAREIGCVGDLPTLFSFPNLCGEEKDINQKVPGSAYWNLGKWNLPLAESRVHAACLEFKASRFTAGLSMGAMIELKPVSNGLFFRLQPRRPMNGFSSDPAAR